ncbi:MAG: SET domain-containing protein [Leptonema sp. (in: Bacteria)]|nr:SET domain-containing protein [Leptonema sp. (in: bacteria)]
MQNHTLSFLSEKAEVRRTNHGNGIFAIELIAKDELIAVWGGAIYEESEFRKLSELERSIAIQIEERFYMTPIEINDADYVNHSCSPNAGLQGQIELVAIRDIQPNEEICFDYAMSDSSPYDEFDCDCGSSMCRGRVTGTDWQNQELQTRYKGYFSSYLQRKIDRLHNSHQ